MKKAFLRYSSHFFLIVCGIAGLLLFVSGRLYHQNSSYKMENRKLIIQNDSIISVNIELKKALLQKNAWGSSASTSVKD